MRISYWSSDVCSSDLAVEEAGDLFLHGPARGWIECWIQRDVILIREPDFVVVENSDEAIGKLWARGGRRSSGPAGLVEPLAIAEARSGDAHVAVDAALAHGDGCTARTHGKRRARFADVHAHARQERDAFRKSEVPDPSPDPVSWLQGG